MFFLCLRRRRLHCGCSASDEEETCSPIRGYESPHDLRRKQEFFATKAACEPVLEREPVQDVSVQAARVPKCKTSSGKTHKYGTCSVHGAPMRPVVHCSGPTAGQCLLRCSQWWHFTNGKRSCWHCRPFNGDVTVFTKRHQASAEFGLIHCLKA